MQVVLGAREIRIGEIEIHGDVWDYLDLLASLRRAKIDKVSWVGEKDEETKVYKVKAMEIKLSTNRVKHELACLGVGYGKVLCEWIVDGEDTGMIIFDKDEYPINEALDIIRTLVRTERVANNEVTLRRE